MKFSIKMKQSFKNNYTYNDALIRGAWTARNAHISKLSQNAKYLEETSMEMRSGTFKFNLFWFQFITYWNFSCPQFNKKFYYSTNFMFWIWNKNILSLRMSICWTIFPKIFIWIARESIIECSRVMRKFFYLKSKTYSLQSFKKEQNQTSDMQIGRKIKIFINLRICKILKCDKCLNQLDLKDLTSHLYFIHKNE